MKLLPRDVGQMLVSKLDRGLIRPSEAINFAHHTYGVTLTGRTRDSVARSVINHMEPAK